MSSPEKYKLLNTIYGRGRHYSFFLFLFLSVLQEVPRLLLCMKIHSPQPVTGCYHGNQDTPFRVSHIHLMMSQRT